MKTISCYVIGCIAIKNYVAIASEELKVVEPKKLEVDNLEKEADSATGAPPAIAENTGSLPTTPIESGVLPAENTTDGSTNANTESAQVATSEPAQVANPESAQVANPESAQVANPESTQVANPENADKQLESGLALPYGAVNFQSPEPLGCMPVSVQRDATYCIPGPICSGSGPSPAGINCPIRGTPAIQDCLPTLPSAQSGGCIAPMDAKCVIVIADTWGCAYEGLPMGPPMGMPMGPPMGMPLQPGFPLESSESNTTGSVIPVQTDTANQVFPGSNEVQATGGMATGSESIKPMTEEAILPPAVTPSKESQSSDQLSYLTTPVSESPDQNSATQKESAQENETPPDSAQESAALTASAPVNPQTNLTKPAEKAPESTESAVKQSNLESTNLTKEVPGTVPEQYHMNC